MRVCDKYADQVWTIKTEEIHCVQVLDVKEAVYELTANNKLACFISQGTGVKASWFCPCKTHVQFNIKNF